MNRPTHKQKVLLLLGDGLPHSHMEGYRLGVMLHSRVADLRRDGHDIECWRERDLYWYGARAVGWPCRDSCVGWGHPTTSRRASVPQAGRGMTELELLIEEQARDMATDRVWSFSLDQFADGEPPVRRLVANDSRHGTEGCYQNQRCRCPKCREAHRAYRAARRARGIPLRYA